MNKQLLVIGVGDAASDPASNGQIVVTQVALNTFKVHIIGGTLPNGLDQLVTSNMHAAFGAAMGIAHQLMEELED